MNWGRSIILAFVLFGLFLTLLAVKSFRSDISLVSNDYYQQELAYQNRIDKLENEQNLEESVVIKLNKEAGLLVVKFPESFSRVKGTVVLYRPADAAQDRQWIIDLDHNNLQSFPLQDCASGLWKLKLDWEVQGLAYYKEQTVYLP